MAQQGLERIPYAVGPDFRMEPVRARFPEQGGSAVSLVPGSFVPDAAPEPKPVASEDPGYTGDIWRGLKYGAQVQLPKMAGQALQFFGADGVGKSMVDAAEARATPDMQESAVGQAEKSPYSVRGSVYEAATNAVPSLGPGAAGAAAGAAVGSVVPVVGPALGALAGYALGSVAALPMFYGSQAKESYDAVKANQLQQGKSESEADAIARRTAHAEGAIEAGGELVADVIPFAKLFKPFAKPVGNAIVKSALVPTIKGGAKTVGGVVAAEVGTEMTQQAGQNAVRKSMGGTGPGATWEETQKVIMPTALMSVIPGMAGAGAKHVQQSAALRALVSPDTDPETRSKIAIGAAEAIKAGSPEVSKAFAAYAADQIAARAPIEIADDAFYASAAGPQPVEGTFIPADRGGPPVATQYPGGNTFTQDRAPAQFARPGLPAPAPLDGDVLGPQALLPPGSIDSTATEIKDAAPAPTLRQQALSRGLLTHSKAPSPDMLKRLMRVDDGMAQRLYDEWAAAQTGPRQKVSPTDGGQDGQGQETAQVLSGAGEQSPAITPLEVQAHAAATSPFNQRPQPTDAQKKAGNYAKGHVRFHGMDISIENPAGSVRAGKDEDGKAWETTMQHHYGYIKGTVGRDKDHLDVFIKPGAQSARTAYVIDQTNPKTGAFDEHKIVLGADSEQDARAIYQSNYQPGWNGLGAITAMPIDEFKAWIDSGKTKKPIAYKEPKGTAKPAAATAKAGPASFGKVGPAPGAARAISLKDNGDGTATVMAGDEPFYDFDSGDPVRVPADAKPSVVKQSIIDAGAVTSKDRWFGVNDGETLAKPASEVDKAKPSEDLAAMFDDVLAEETGKADSPSQNSTYSEPRKNQQPPVTSPDGYADTPRIRQLRQRSVEIEAGLPPVSSGMTRLWRGNRPGEVGKNPQFTNSLIGIALPFSESYGGPVSYVDVRTSDLSRYENTGTAASGAEFILPAEVAAKAKTVGEPGVAPIPASVAPAATGTAVAAGAQQSGQPAASVEQNAKSETQAALPSTGDTQAKATIAGKPVSEMTEDKLRNIARGLSPTYGEAAVDKAKAELRRRSDVAATHIEGGKREAATPAVVAESIKESAANTPMDIAEARAWLLKEIDQAITDAKSAEEEGWWDRVNQRISENADLKEIGYKTFDVPGDGKFRVLNTKENLAKFRKSVQSSAGFKKNAGSKFSLATGITKTTPRDMLDDGDYQLAVEYGKLIGKPLLFGITINGGTPVVYTDASEVEAGGFNLRVGREWTQSGKANGWAVIELSTGLRAAFDSTEAKAVRKVENAIQQFGTDGLRDQIGKADKVSQVELESKWIEWAAEEETKNERMRERARANDKADNDLWNRLWPLKAGQQRIVDPWDRLTPSALPGMMVDAIKAGEGEALLALFERRTGLNGWQAIDARKALAEKQGKPRLDATGRDSDSGWHFAGVGLGGHREQRRQIELKDGTDIEGIVFEVAGQYFGGSVRVNGKTVFEVNEREQKPAQPQVDAYISNHFGSKMSGRDTAYPFFSRTDNKLYDENGHEITDKAWTGVAMSHSGNLFFKIGYENGERSYAPLKSKVYADAIEEARGTSVGDSSIPSSRDGNGKKEPWQMTQEEYVESQMALIGSERTSKTAKWLDARRDQFAVEWGESREAAAIAGKPVKVKPAWMRTQREWTDATGNGTDEHYERVKDAVELNKPVPAEVLADYPDLQKKVSDGGTAPAASIADESFLAKPEGWDGMDVPAREALVIRAGWTTKSGSINSWGKQIVKRSWADTPQGTRNTLARFAGDGLDTGGTASDPIERHADLMARLREGTATLDEFKAGYADVVDGKPGITEALSKLTKDAIFERFPGLAYRYKNDKKAEVIDAAYRSMLDSFAYVGNDGIQWTYGQKYEDVIRGYVDRATEAELRKYADDQKAAKEDREARQREADAGMENPVTLDDYKRILAAKAREIGEGATFAQARMAMTPEQRARFDELAGEASREQRQARADQQRTEVRVAAQTTEGQIVETKHTKTGEPLFVVKAADRVEREVYNQWNAQAKKLGGWYSSYRGGGAVPGFQFKTRENADAFLKYLGGDVAPAKEAMQARRDAFADDRTQSAAERLEEMAAGLDERADESLSVERKANTERRARMAAGAEAAAQQNKAMARTMRNIADKLRNGSAKFLDRVRQKVQVEMLDGFVTTAKGNELRAKYEGYAEQEKHRFEPATAETADYAEFPAYTFFRSDLASLGRQMLEQEGTKKLGAAVMRIADDVSAAYTKFAKENFHKVALAKSGGGLAAFPSRDAAEAAIRRSGFKGKAIVLPIKRGENAVVMSPSEASERGIWTGDPDKRLTLPAELGDEVAAKTKELGRLRIAVPWMFERTAEQRKRLKAIGIETPAEFRAALREFIAAKSNVEPPSRIKELERKMIGRKNDGLDFFPTPAGVAQRMVESADIQEGMAVLEPSAGMGHIAEAIREAGVDPDVMELSGDRRELLDAKGFNVIGSDFMDISPRGYTYGDVFRHKDGRLGVMRGTGGMGSNRVGFVPEGYETREWVDREDLTGERKAGANSGYDRILMNPPFSERRDAEHVRHAYTLLRPGGRIVAIMGEGVFFGQDKKAQAFRDWLDEVGGTSEKLEEGTFLDPSLPVNTGVNARLVVIDKPQGVQEQDKSEGDAGAPRESRAAQDSIGTAGRLAITQAKSIVAKFLDVFKRAADLDIRIVASPDEIPTRYRPSRYAEGVYHSDIGTIWLVTDNLMRGGKLNASRVFQVLLHEAVGHHGLAAMMGDKFKSLKARVLATAKAKGPVVDDYYKPGDADYATVEAVRLRYPDATDDQVADEVLARMAETDPGRTLFGYVRAVVRQWLRDVARKLGIQLDTTVAELNDLVALASGYMRRGTGMSGERAPGGVAAASLADAGLESRARPGSNEAIWDAPDPTTADNVIYTLQDKHIDLKRVQAAIKESIGKELPDQIDPYLQEELFHGRAAKATEEFLDRELQPLIGEMKQRGISMDSLETYLWARHAGERNAQIAKINPDMPDGGSGLTDKQARDVLAGKDVTVGGQTVKGIEPAKLRGHAELARKIDMMVAGNRLLLELYELETPSTLAAWKGAYQHYVPLHREDVDSPWAGQGTGQGYSVRGASTKRATGSYRPVENILANLVMQRKRIITRGEKNRVAQALYGLATVMKNPDFWKVDDVPKIRVPKEMAIYHVMDGDTEVANYTRMSEADKHAAKIPGGYVYQSWGERVVEQDDPTFRSRPNVVWARFGGEDRFVIFNERNERAMRLAEALKNLDADDISHFLGEVSRWTRYFASINTQYNPVFGVVNLTRDTGTGLLNLKSTPLEGKQAEMLGHVWQALPAIYRAIRIDREGGTPTGTWAELWEEFQEVGGQTGYRDMFRNATEQRDALEAALDPKWWQDKTWGKVLSAGGLLAPAEQALLEKAGKPVLDWLSDYNTTMENAIRLSAYKVARDHGMSRERAASLAKNLTVNFNRKGQSARQLGALYAFFNASVQGTARMLETLKHGRKPGNKLGRAGKQIVYGGLLLGSMQAMWLAAAGFDDDEPPEFVRDRAIIIPLPDKRYLSVPLPLGFHVLPALGRIGTEQVLNGFKAPGRAAFHVLDVMADAFNPIGNAGMSMQTLAPTVLDPAAALAENKDWTGKKIYRENFSQLDPKPGHQRTKDTATALSKWLSQALNSLTGGTEFQPGGLSPTPDQIDYLIGQVTGGVGREVSKLAQTGGAIATGEELPAYKIPLLGRFYGDAKGQAAVSSRFYENLKAMNMHQAEFMGLATSNRGEQAKAYLEGHPEASMFREADRMQRYVGKLQDEKRKAIADRMPSAKVKEIDAKITEAMQGFNARVAARRMPAVPAQ